MRTWRWYSKLLFALVVAAFAYCVWPTPWMYYPVSATTIRTLGLHRVNRMTGRVEYYNGSSHRWERA